MRLGVSRKRRSLSSAVPSSLFVIVVAVDDVVVAVNVVGLVLCVTNYHPKHLMAFLGRISNSTGANQVGKHTSLHG